MKSTTEPKPGLAGGTGVLMRWNAKRRFLSPGKTVDPCAPDTAGNVLQRIVGVRAGSLAITVRDRHACTTSELVIGGHHPVCTHALYKRLFCQHFYGDGPIRD